jgi:hypothetical protein
MVLQDFQEGLHKRGPGREGEVDSGRGQEGGRERREGRREGRGEGRREGGGKKAVTHPWVSNPDNTHTLGTCHSSFRQAV